MIIPGFFTLDSYALGLTILDPLGTAQVGGMVSATGKLGSVDIGVAALHPASGGWQFSGYIGKEHGVPIGSLVHGLASQFGVPIPETLVSFTLNDFEFAFDTLTYNASGRFSLDFDVNGTPVDLTVSAALTHQGSSYTVVVDGVLLVGDSRFEVSFGKAPSTFTASWSDAAHPLEFGDIAARFGFFDVPPIPASLDLQLVKADITYDFAKKSLVVDAVSKTYGAAAFVATAGHYVFGLPEVPRTIDLSDLPLLKTVLGPGGDRRHPRPAGDRGLRRPGPHRGQGRQPAPVRHGYAAGAGRRHGRRCRPVDDLPGRDVLRAPRPVDRRHAPAVAHGRPRRRPRLVPRSASPPREPRPSRGRGQHSRQRRGDVGAPHPTGRCGTRCRSSSARSPSAA